MANSELDLCMRCMTRLNANGICPGCGYAGDQPADPAHLLPGMMIGTRYIVGLAQASNAEGIRYPAYDIAEKCRVTVVEYMPAAIAVRDEYSMGIRPLRGSETTYKALMMDFQDLAAKLRNLSGDPAVRIVGVQDILHENNTCYVVYKHIAAVKLSAMLHKAGGEMSWTNAKRLFMPVLATLAALHKHGIIHRGLCPETLLASTDGNIYVAGFCIASARTGQSAIGAELFPGYCAPEQYRQSDWQGEWTDVYSVAAVLYRVLTGSRPPEATERSSKDHLLPPARLNPDIPENVSGAIYDAMRLGPKDRIGSMDAFSAHLLEATGTNTAAFIPGVTGTISRQAVHTEDENPAEPEPKKPEKAVRRRVRRGMPYGFIAMLITLTILLVISGGYIYYRYQQLPRSDGDGGAFVSDIDLDAAAKQESKVPDFAGMYVESIRSNEEYGELFDFSYEQEYNDSYPADIVFGQSVEKNTVLEEGERMAITLYVSKGSEYVKMPNLVGSTMEFAMETLSAMGIKYEVLPIYDSRLEPGQVVRTSKDPDENVNINVDIVLLFVREEKEESQSSQNSADTSDSSRVIRVE